LALRWRVPESQPCFRLSDGRLITPAVVFNDGILSYLFFDWGRDAAGMKGNILTALG
jgi:hypothetical protein